MSPGGVARSTDIYWPKTKPMPPECALKVIDGVVDRPGKNFTKHGVAQASFFAEIGKLKAKKTQGNPENSRIFHETQGFCRKTQYNRQTYIHK